MSTWTKMESWRPLDTFKDAPTWAVTRRNGCEFLHRNDTFRRWRRFRTRAAALRAANTANRRDGLPEVL